MMTQRQVKEIVKLLKAKDLAYRPSLQQCFESGGYMWASDGYVALELFECKEQTLGKCAKLSTLQRWLATSTNKDMFDGWEELEDSMPDMCKLIHSDWVEPSSIKFDIKRLKQCCDFLKTSQFAIKSSSKNSNLHMVVPINDGMTNLERAMCSKAYIMGPK